MPPETPNPDPTPDAPPFRSAPPAPPIPEFFFKPLAPIQALFVFIFIILAILIALISSTTSSRTPDFQGATILIHALDQYRFDHGKYPANINQLVPNYLTKIPFAYSNSVEWIYSGDATGFDLGVHSPVTSETYTYISTSNEWLNDDY